MCRGKSQGGRRCDALAHLMRDLRRGVVKTFERGIGASEADALNAYHIVRNWSVLTYEKTALATREAVAATTRSLKEALSMTNINRSEQETVLRRMKNSLGDEPTVQRLSIWQKVVAILRDYRKHLLIGGVSLTVLATTACGPSGDGSLSPEEVVTPTPGVSQSQTTEPGETSAPGEVVDNETSFAIDAASVTVPQDVIDAYGAEAAANLVPDTLAVASLANELQELHHARDGEESGYWSVYREQVTPELNTRIQESVAAYAAGDAEAGERLTGLQPYAERDGSLGTFNGEVFRVGEQGINVEITNMPTVTLSDHGRVSVDLPQTITAVSDTGKTLTFTKNQVLFMVPGEGGRWLLDSYAPENITPVEVS